MGKRYAFIDVYNTDNTTKQLLNFSIDWVKLYNFLKNKWKCEEVFFYSGVEPGDNDTADEHERLKTFGYKMKVKTIMVYKEKIR